MPYRAIVVPEMKVCVPPALFGKNVRLVIALVLCHKPENKAKMPELLEAPFVVLCNDMFHKISESIREEVGALDSKKIFFNWDNWLKKEIKKKKVK